MKQNIEELERQFVDSLSSEEEQGLSYGSKQFNYGFVMGYNYAMEIDADFIIAEAKAEWDEGEPLEGRTKWRARLDGRNGIFDATRSYYDWLVKTIGPEDAAELLAELEGEEAAEEAEEVAA